MGISETKKQIVIDNYFKNTCDVNTSIKEAFTRGFELGLKKAPTTSQPKTGHWISHYDEDAKEGWYECDRCHTERAFNTDYCPDCGAKMQEVAK